MPEILLVEDDDADALLVQEELRDVPDAPVLRRARSLPEAVDLIDGGDLDCALLDLGLPGTSGLDALTTLRAHAPDLPIVVLTGMAGESHGIAALGAGAQDYLVKGAVGGPVIARAIRYAIERRRAEHAQAELREATLTARENARLERGLLPRPLIKDDSTRFGAEYRPGRTRSLLGGDFFDIVQTEKGTTRIIVGDVCGHGPDEAALGAGLRIAWRTLVLNDADLDDVLPTLDRVLINERHSDDLVFATIADICIEPDRAGLNVRLAGHPPPFKIADGRVGTVNGSVGLPIGLGATENWPVNHATLAPGDALMLYTDGLIEGYAGDARPARLGLEGLAGLLEDRMREPSWDRDLDGFLRDVIDRVETLNGGAVTDDIATLIVTWS